MGQPRQMRVLGSLKEQSYVTSFPPDSNGVHFDRAVGRHRDHRRVDRPLAAGRANGPRSRSAQPVRQQPEAARRRPAQLSRRLRDVPAGQPRGLRRRLHELHRLRHAAAVHRSRRGLQRDELQHLERQRRHHVAEPDCGAVLGHIAEPALGFHFGYSDDLVRPAGLGGQFLLEAPQFAD